MWLLVSLWVSYLPFLFTTWCGCVYDLLQVCWFPHCLEMSTWLWPLLLPLWSPSWCLVAFSSTASKFSLLLIVILTMCDDVHYDIMYIGITIFVFCLDSTLNFWIAQPFVIQVGNVVYHYKLDGHANKWFSVFTVEVTVRACIVKIWLFLQGHLN